MSFRSVAAPFQPRSSVSAGSSLEALQKTVNNLIQGITDNTSNFMNQAIGHEVYFSILYTQTFSAMQLNNPYVFRALIQKIDLILDRYDDDSGRLLAIKTDLQAAIQSTAAPIVQEKKSPSPEPQELKKIIDALIKKIHALNFDLYKRTINFTDFYNSIYALKGSVLKYNHAVLNMVFYNSLDNAICVLPFTQQRYLEGLQNIQTEIAKLLEGSFTSLQESQPSPVLDRLIKDYKDAKKNLLDRQRITGEIALYVSFRQLNIFFQEKQLNFFSYLEGLNCLLALLLKYNKFQISITFYNNLDIRINNLPEKQKTLVFDKTTREGLLSAYETLKTLIRELIDSDLKQTKLISKENYSAKLSELIALAADTAPFSKFHLKGIVACLQQSQPCRILNRLAKDHRDTKKGSPTREQTRNELAFYVSIRQLNTAFLDRQMNFSSYLHKMYSFADQLRKYNKFEINITFYSNLDTRINNLPDEQKSWWFDTRTILQAYEALRNEVGKLIEADLNKAKLVSEDDYLEKLGELTALVSDTAPFLESHLTSLRYKLSNILLSEDIARFNQYFAKLSQFLPLQFERKILLNLLRGDLQKGHFPLKDILETQNIHLLQAYKNALLEVVIPSMAVGILTKQTDALRQSLVKLLSVGTAQFLNLRSINAVLDYLLDEFIVYLPTSSSSMLICLEKILTHPSESLITIDWQASLHSAHNVSLNAALREGAIPDFLATSTEPHRDPHIPLTIKDVKDVHAEETLVSFYTRAEKVERPSFSLWSSAMPLFGSCLPAPKRDLDVKDENKSTPNGDTAHSHFASLFNGLSFTLDEQKSSSRRLSMTSKSSSD